MTQNHDDNSENDNELSSGDDPNSISGGQRREPLFSGFDEEDFEEPERDTDYSSGYGTDSVEEEEFDDIPAEDKEHGLAPVPDTELPLESATSWEEPDQTDTEDHDGWLEEDGYEEEEGDGDGKRWPFGLIAVALIALVLLAVGGYGVIQQRSASEEEISRLQALLATAASPEDVRTSRAALQDMKAAHAELTATADALTRENRGLTDTVAGLEAQLKAQQTALTKKTASAAPRVKPTPPPPAAPASRTTQATAAEISTGWFVNFGSYASRSMAETWAARLHPVTGKTIIASNTSNGKTIYRVRVVDLPTKDAAEKVARKLESDFDMSRLWVGKAK